MFTIATRKILSGMLKHMVYSIPEINPGSSFTFLHTFDDQRINRLRELSRQHAVSLSLHLPYSVNIGDIIRPIRSNNKSFLKRTIQLTSELEAEFITAHIGNFYWFPHRNWTRRKALACFTKNLSEIIGSCEEADVIVALENAAQIPDGSDYYFLGDCSADSEYIFSRIQSPFLRFCLDTGHANMGEGVETYFTKFREKLVSIHFHDNNGANDEHLPVGSGTIAWDAFAAFFSANHFTGPFISECRNIEPHQAARLMIGYFNKLVNMNG